MNRVLLLHPKVQQFPFTCFLSLLPVSLLSSSFKGVCLSVVFLACKIWLPLPRLEGNFFVSYFLNLFFIGQAMITKALCQTWHSHKVRVTRTAKAPVFTTCLPPGGMKPSHSHSILLLFNSQGPYKHISKCTCDKIWSCLFSIVQFRKLRMILLSNI